jgi:hypothetical protein
MSKSIPEVASELASSVLELSQQLTKARAKLSEANTTERERELTYNSTSYQLQQANTRIDALQERNTTLSCALSKLAREARLKWDAAGSALDFKSAIDFADNLLGASARPVTPPTPDRCLLLTRFAPGCNRVAIEGEVVVGYVDDCGADTLARLTTYLDGWRARQLIETDEDDVLPY